MDPTRCARHWFPGEILRSEVEADIAGSTLKSSLYPHHLTSVAPFHDELGSGHMLTVAHTGLPGMPDLDCDFRVYDDEPWGDIQVRVHNSTSQPIDVHAIRVVRGDSRTVLTPERAGRGRPYSLRQL